MLCIITTIRKEINPFQTNAQFLYPPKVSVSLWFSYVFTRYTGHMILEVGLFSQRSIFSNASFALFLMELFFLLSNILREEKFMKEVSAEEIFAKFIFEIYDLIWQSLFCKKQGKCYLLQESQRKYKKLGRTCKNLFRKNFFCKQFFPLRYVISNSNMLNVEITIFCRINRRCTNWINTFQPNF